MTRRLLLLLGMGWIGVRTAMGFAVGLVDPQFFFPDGASAEARKSVMVFAKEKAGFRGGWNYPGAGQGATTQWYGGNGAALQGLLQLLREAGIEAQVKFVEGKDRDVAFSVFQDGTRPGAATVHVNLRKRGLDLGGLVLGVPRVGEG